MDDTTAAAVPDTSAPPGPTAAASIESLIERWWEEHFPGSPVAQLTQAWNHAFAAKEALKRLLREFAGGTANR
jgi:hypothetical protein